MVTERDTYQVAISMATAEGEAIWSRANAYLLANSILVAAIVLTPERQTTSLFLVPGMATAGIVLSVIWGLSTERGFRQQRRFVALAREIEERASLPAQVTVLMRGAIIGPTQRALSYTLIVLFASIYGAFLLASA
ncbi:MAG: hypothetical protein WC211_05965 [Dehalococcoidia bacterium]